MGCRHARLHCMAVPRLVWRAADPTTLALACPVGARLLASPDDGVQLVQSVEDDADLARQLAPGSPVRLASSSGEAEAPLSPRASQLRPVQAPAAAPAAAQRSTIEIVLSAVGVGLQFVHLEPADGNGVKPSGSRPGSGLDSRPGSGLGSRHGSAGDLARAASLQASASQQVLAAGPAQQKGATASGRTVQMLAAYLDLSAHYKTQASGARAVLVAGARGRMLPSPRLASRCVSCSTRPAALLPALPARRALCRAGVWRCRGCGSRHASLQACWGLRWGCSHPPSGPHASPRLPAPAACPHCTQTWQPGWRRETKSPTSSASASCEGSAREACSIPAPSPSTSSSWAAATRGQARSLQAQVRRQRGALV